jgi:putative transposase
LQHGSSSRLAISGIVRGFDELYLKIKGNPKYIFALMDDQTRFWIAQQVADTKYTSNIQPLLKTQNKLQEKDQIP